MTAAGLRVAGPDAQRQLASLPLAILLLAPDLTIAGANPAAEQFFGQSLRRLSGRRLTDVLTFGEARLAERIGDGETPVSARDIDVVVPGRGARQLDLTATPIVDEPGWRVLSLHDTTIEAMGEDAGGADNTILRAPEILAHEIRNPLAGIRGAAQLLARKAGEADRVLTGLIADEVDRIAKLIDQMQTLGRRTIAPVEPCNLHEAARRAVAVMDAAGGAEPPIGEEFDPSLPPVLGSPDGLVQVVINLLANARDACRAVAGPRIVIRTRFASGLRLHSPRAGKPVRLPVELRVSDNGPGIDPAMREHIFEPFVTTKKTGQGLGLALVRKLVRDMNGRISHERDDERGWTHFRVYLPLAAEADARRGRGGGEA
ncbi:MAG: PAS domain-containing protein [Novosphingobium sp.]|jgi:two-component system nitrogen regulation sensor histidine kinase GlnL|nr:PAS domain-containing protein [Novosphingobium sp.]